MALFLPVLLLALILVALGHSRARDPATPLTVPSPAVLFDEFASFLVLELRAD